MEIVKPINNINGLRVEAKSVVSENLDQHYYGHGKLLLTGEYFILNGAKGLAMPTKLGQSLSVRYSQSFSPTLYWKSFDYEGQLWFEGKFEFWHFNILNEEVTPQLLMLQSLLRQARSQNFHFLREEVDVHVECRLEFPIEWGLGSSSTLIYNIAQWAYISPFELLFKALGKGSGYDIACAQSQGPINYMKEENPKWETATFSPSFIDNLYFLYLGKKQSTDKAIDHYLSKKCQKQKTIDKITEITERFTMSKDLEEFDELILRHENLISENLGLEKAKDRDFSDYWGQIKSLGAWGGDFALVTSNRSFDETREYFLEKNLNVLMPFNELVINPTQSFANQIGQHDLLH